MSSQTVVPSEVGWQFVPQYYAYINKEPERLHCFYSKQSVFVHGTEGEEAKTCNGQQEIHAQITELAFQDCRIFIHSVDAQSSANGGIVIQVIGEMSNKSGPWRKFVQTFFLAEQTNGYFVLNDIFRFLKEDAIEGEEGEETAEAGGAPVEETQQPAPVSREPTPPPSPPPAPIPVEEPPTTVSDLGDEPASAPEPEPVPEPVSAPAESATEAPPSQPNGVHPETEPEKPKSPIPPSPAPPAPAQTQPTPPSQPAQPTPPPPPPPQQQQQQQQPAQPAPPPAAPVPKTWANLAAANSKKWGAAVAQESRGTTEVVPAAASGPVSATASGSQTPQRRAATPLYQAALNVTIPHCFIKNISDSVTEAALKTALSKFGSLKSVEVVPFKACAFAEFASVDAARRAITASIDQGGIVVGDTKVIVETKRDRSERERDSRGDSRGDGRGDGGRGRGGRGGGGGMRGRGGGGSMRGRGGAK